MKLTFEEKVQLLIAIRAREAGLIAMLESYGREASSAAAVDAEGVLADIVRREADLTQKLETCKRLEHTLDLATR